MTRSEAAFWLWSGIERRANVVPAAAPVENHQSRHLGSHFGFALLGQELPKLHCERGEHGSEEWSFFSLYGYWMLLGIHDARLTIGMRSWFFRGPEQRFGNQFCVAKCCHFR
jgi:hypothetical protein